MIAMPQGNVPDAEAALDPAPLASIRQYQRPGGPDLVARIVSVFLEESAGRVETLLEGLRGGDAEAAARAAHALKSACGNVGAMRLAALCRDIEAHARANRNAEAATRAAELELEYARARAALQSL